MQKQETDCRFAVSYHRRAWKPLSGHTAPAGEIYELRLIPKRMYFLFRNDEAGITWLHSNKPWFGPENADRLIRLCTFVFYALIALSLASLPAWWKLRDLRRMAVFAVVPLYILIFGVLFIGDPRYHYAMYVPLAVFGGYGMSLLSRVTEESWREAFGSARRGTALPTYGTPEP